MPQALPLLKVFIVKLATSKALGFVIARALITNFVLSKLSKALAPSTGGGGPPPINVTVRGTVEDRRLVFGTVRTGGVMTFYGASGTNNNFLWYVTVLAGHQVSAITDVWLDTVRIPTADIDGSGNVTAGVFSGKCVIYRLLGTGAQTTNSALDSAFTEITSNHRWRGCALLIVRMERSDTAYPNGAPQSASALVSGALLYDPRLDSTNGGSGSHRAADPSTWAFSRNPALVARWILTGGSVVNDQSSRLIKYGLRESDTRIDDTFFRAAANECDESLAGGNAPPSGAQVRYTCDIELRDGPTGQTPREMLTEVMATMAGEIVYVKGKWRVYAGAYDTPTHTISQDDVYGEIEVQDTSPGDERYNAVAPIYIDASKQYVEQTGIFRTSSTYETQDGERKETELQVRGCTDTYRAQRLAEIHERRSREMRTIRFPGCRDLLKIAPYETFTFNHARWGWSGRVFRLLERQFDFNEDAGQVVIVARQIYSGTFTDLVTADYTTGTSANDTRQVETPDAITNATATSFPQAIRFTLTLPAFYRAGSRIEVWEYTSNTPFASATLIGLYDSNIITIPKRDTTTRYYWFQVRGAAGGLSGPYPSGNGLAGVAALVVATDVSPNGLTVTYSAEDTGTTSVVTSGGVPVLTQRLCEVSFTPDIDGDVTVTITYESESDTATSPNVEAILRESGVNVATGTDNNPPLTRGMATSQLEFTVTGGLTYTAALNVKQSTQPVTSVFYRIQTIVEYRRR
jgi:hypothetical protein